MKKVVLLHTSFVFFNREKLFFELFDEILPDVLVTNIVDDTMAQEVIDHGSVNPGLTRRMCCYVLASSATGADAIFNTCSSMGPAIDIAKQLVDTPIIKIDEGMAEKAAQTAQKIGVLATSGSTLKPTVDLIKEKAKVLNKNLETRTALCDGAFQLLMEGHVERHDAFVVEKANEISRWADTLVLAQASMAKLAPRLTQETGIPVLTSPRLGIERLKRVLEGNP
jgi:Asp/Glu/hydantoin racemase